MIGDLQFVNIEPQILYMGTPVALITTVSETGNANIGPMSSVWTLGWTMLLGLECGSKTYQNLMTSRECVVNYPAARLFDKVEKIANLTGADPVPGYKKDRYKFDPDKFATGGFTRLSSDLIAAPRIAECSLQFETRLKNVIEIDDDPKEAGPVAAMEVRILKVHVEKSLVIKDNHIDPNKWEPLIYNFRHYYGLGHDLGKTFKADV